MPITHPSGAVRIDADRVYLREFEPTDFEQAYEYASDPRVSEYLGSPSTPDEERAFLDRCVARRAATPRTELELAICEKASGQLIGGCGLEHLDASREWAMLGYAMNPRFWGHGYMTEALRALLAFGFGTLSLHRVWAMCNVDNARSVAVLERLGMRREGTFVDHQRLRGKWSSSHLYALLRREFERP